MVVFLKDGEIGQCMVGASRAVCWCYLYISLRCPFFNLCSKLLGVCVRAGGKPRFVVVYCL